MSERPRLLLVHGVLSGRSVWGPVIRELGDDAECIAVNLPGYGRTAWPGGPYDLPPLVDWLEALAQREQPTHIVGHSMGGILALALSGRENVTFEAAGVIGLPCYHSAEEGLAYLGRRGRVVSGFVRYHRVSHCGCLVARNTVGLWHGWAKRRLPAHPARVIRDVFHHSAPAHSGALSRIVFGGHVESLAERVRRPVAALHGDGDRAAPFGPVVELAERRGWDLHVEPGANHQVLVERPAFTADWIRGHVLTVGEQKRSSWIEAAGGS